MKIRTKFVLYSFLVAFVPMVMVLLIVYPAYRALYTKSISDKLEAVAQTQENRIADILIQKNEFVNLLSSRLLIINDLHGYLVQHSSNFQKGINDSLNNTLVSTQIIKKIYVVTLDGQIIASTDTSLIGKNIANEDYFLNGQKQTSVDRLVKDPDGSVNNFLIGPMINNGTVEGVLVCVVNADDIVGVAEDYTGLGTTGETLLAKNDGKGNALFLTPLRFDKGAALNRVESGTNVKVPIIRAISGESRVSDNLSDYRGVPVIAATRFIKSTGWGVVVKMDKAEVFAPMNGALLMLLLPSSLISILIVVITLIVSRIITRPLELLGIGASNFATGKFTYRIDLKGRDEFGLVASQFNRMAEKLEDLYSNLEKKIEERTKKIRDDEEKLRELDILKDDFLSVTTHELKTPLIPIKAQAQMLMAGDYGKLTTEQMNAVEMIYRNEENLNTLSGEVLDITKMKSHKFKLILEKTSIDEIVSNAVKDMSIYAKQNKILLKLLPIPKIPKMTIDGGRIKQVLNNLLDNAIKFTPENGHVTVELKKTDDEIVLTVDDTGVGVSMENINKLFTPFFQIDSSLSRRYRGTGLGLAVSKGIIEAHGGKIWAESKGLDKGSIFGFRLPINNHK